MKPTHNAECPVCHDKWRFNPRYAILNEQERRWLMLNSKLTIVCEDCISFVDCESKQVAEWSFVN